MPMTLEQIKDSCKSMKWTKGQEESFECDHNPSGDEIRDLTGEINQSATISLGVVQSGTTITVKCY